MQNNYHIGWVAYEERKVTEGEREGEVEACNIKYNRNLLIGQLEPNGMIIYCDTNEHWTMRLCLSIRLEIREIHSDFGF